MFTPRYRTENGNPPEGIARAKKERTMNPNRMLMLAGVVFLAAASAAPELIRMDASMAQPYMLVGQAQKAYLKVSITGEGNAPDAKRIPVNLAIVLDKSGSMDGQKIADAKAAAIKAVGLLAPDDIVSVVAYDDGVYTVVPATKAGDRETIVRGIESLYAGGSTALFAGVSKGAAELRKFYDPNHVNRIILLSDGLANVGPSAPGDLAELGTSLGREGIAVTTIGLGLDYNEDLMTQLAQKSDGNHMFAKEPGDLDRIFAQELGSVTSVVAQNIEIVIDCANGVRPIRILGRDADIVGGRVITSMNQLYADNERYVLLEVELPEAIAANGANVQVAEVACSFDDARKQGPSQQSVPVAVTFTDSNELVQRHTDKLAMASVVEQVGVEENKKAVVLRDEGKIEEAKQVLEQNAQMLLEGAQQYDSKELESYYRKNEAAKDNIDDEEGWKKQRKVMREEQHQLTNQQQVNN